MEKTIEAQIRRLAAGETLPTSPMLANTLVELGLATHEAGSQIRLAEPLELLDADRIRCLMQSGASCEPHVCWQIDSTNTYLMQRSAQSGFDGSVCLAEQQLAGRGRRGRHWVSPFGRNVYMSIGQRLELPAQALGGLSLVAGICVVRVLRAHGIASAGLKWPNDVLSGGGKLAGILTEIASANRDFSRVVIGIGINLRLDADDLRGIDQPPAVANLFGGNRNALVAALLDELLPEVSRFARTGFAPYQQAWSAFDTFRGEVVRILHGESEIEGVNQGVDEAGNILIMTDAGVRAFNSGEVSLRRKLPL